MLLFTPFVAASVEPSGGTFSLKSIAVILPFLRLTPCRSRLKSRKATLIENPLASDVDRVTNPEYRV